MNLFNYSGDTNGSSSTYSSSVKGHFRPFNGDSGTSTIVQSSVLDHVRTNPGKTGNYGFFLPFQLSSTQHTKERNK